MDQSQWDEPQDAEPFDQRTPVPFSGFDDAGGSAEMDMTSNPLFGDAAFTPASAARGEYLNSAYESPGAAAFGSAFGSPAQPWSDTQAGAQATGGNGLDGGGGFDPDPRLFDVEAEVQQILAPLYSSRDPTGGPPTAYAAMGVPETEQVGEVAELRLGSPEDAAFSEVLGALMQQQCSAAEAVRSYADVCRRRAQELRTAAAGQMQRATRYMAMRDEANALDDEAATWLLLWHLAGDKDARFPAGWGAAGGAQGLEDARTTGRTTIHQRAASIIAEDEKINKAARVVAWLEALAGEAMDVEAALMAASGATAARFGATEGVWAETRIRLDAGVLRHGDQQLVSELDPDAPGRQRRPLYSENTADEERILGRLWRLVRAGRIAEAQALCRDCGQPWRAASLGGGGQWGPTPLGAAAAAADAADAHVFEDELADQVVRGDMVPRALWRCAALHAAEAAGATTEPARQGPSAGTLEAAVYGALAGSLASVLPACQRWEDTTWALLRCWLDTTIDHRLSQGGQGEAEGGLDVDLVAAAVPGGGGKINIIQELLGAQRGTWPLPRVMARLPRNFTDVFTDETAADAAPVRAALGAPQRALQAALVLGRPQDVADRLVAWVLPAEGGRPTSTPAAMRFAAHFALALRATGVVPEPSWSEDQYDPLQEALGELVQAYIVHAMSSGATSLVPQLACHLRAGRRHLTYSIFAEQLTAGPFPDAAAAFAEADSWFSRWQGGDVLPGEALVIANQVTEATRRSPAGGPAFRAQAARWLAFVEESLPEAVAHAALLLRELALGLAAAPDPSAAAAWALLHQVLAAGAPRQVLVASPEQLDALNLPPSVAAHVAEVRLWAEVFDNERAFQQWQQQHAAAVEGRGSALAEGEGAALRAATTQLLFTITSFLSEGRFEAAVLGNQDPEAEEPAVMLTAMAAALVAPQSDAEVAALAAGEAYPVLATDDAPEARRVVSDSLRAAIAASPGLPGLEAEVRSGQEEAAGLLSVSIRADGRAGQAAVDAVAATAAALIKGSLPGTAESAGLLWVVNATGSPACVTQAAWRILAPRIALQAAELRQAAVALGASREEGSEVALLVAGVPSQAGDPQPGLAPLFSSRELQELLDWERTTTLLAMHNEEATAATAGGGPSDDAAVCTHETPTNSDGYVML